MPSLLEKNSALLRAAGLRATPARLAVLAILRRAKSPLGPQDVGIRLGKGADLATVYRILSSFAAKGIVREVHLGHGHSDYELADLAHHHHLVCRRCGRTEDVAGCAAMQGMEKTILAASRQFAAIEDHSLELFGTCKGCAASCLPSRGDRRATKRSRRKG